MQQVPINISKHACKRARQRYRWNSSTLERMAARAFETGLQTNNTRGYLKKYMDEKYEMYKSNLRVYGETLFVFADNNLVTIWALPFELRSLAKVFHGKQKKATA